MINTVRDARYYPSTMHHTRLTADSDDVFNGTDLEKIQADGWLLVQAVTDNTDGTIECNQLSGSRLNVPNNIPVLNAGVYPAMDKLPFYKVWCPAGSSPTIGYNEVSGTIVDIIGLYFRGRKNPVAVNTPDITVCVSGIADTTANVLNGTDLEDISWPGTLVVWAASSVGDSQIQIGQMGHKPGRYSTIPLALSGVGIDITLLPAMKCYCPHGEPVVSITEVSAMACIVVASYFVDWKKVNESYPHNPFI